MLAGASPGEPAGDLRRLLVGPPARVLVFGNYLPYAKHFHVITSLPNVFFANARADREAGDDRPREREPRRFGASRVEDFTWKQMLDLLHVHRVRPLHARSARRTLTGKPLIPNELHVDLRDALYTEADAVDSVGGRRRGQGASRAGAAT